MNLHATGPTTAELDDLVRELEQGLSPSTEIPLADEPCEDFQPWGGTETCRNCGWEYDEHD